MCIFHIFFCVSCSVSTPSSFRVVLCKTMMCYSPLRVENTLTHWIKRIFSILLSNCFVQAKSKGKRRKISTGPCVCECVHLVQLSEQSRILLVFHLRRSAFTHYLRQKMTKKDRRLPDICSFPCIFFPLKENKYLLCERFSKRRTLNRQILTEDKTFQLICV